MPWPQSSARRYRLAVTWKIDTTDPISVKLDPELSAFWSQVQSDGYDILVCDAKGADLAHQRTAWTYASKTGAVKITCPTGLPSGSVLGVVYLYWGASATVTSDPMTTVTGTAEDGYVIPDASLSAVGLGVVPPVASGNSYAPGQEVLAPVGATTLALVPVPLHTAALAAQGGTELEDVAGIEVDVLDADADGSPTTPANWWADTNVRALWSAERGAAVLVALTPDAAATATLRVRAYLQGPASGSLPARTAATYALVRGIIPME